MKPFAYVNAANEKEALAALAQAGAQAPRGRILPIAGGMDLLALMKDYIAQPERVVNVKGLDQTIAATPDGGLRIGGGVRLADLAEHPVARKLYPGAHRLGGRGRNAADSQRRHGRRQPDPAPALLVLPQRGVRLPEEGRVALLCRGWGEPVPRDLRERAVLHRPSVEPGRPAHRVRREVPGRGSLGRAHGRRVRLLRVAGQERPGRERAHRERARDARHAARAGRRRAARSTRCASSSRTTGRSRWPSSCSRWAATAPSSARGS